MNKEFYEIHSAEYEEALHVMEVLEIAKRFEISYDDAEAYIEDMKTDPWGF